VTECGAEAPQYWSVDAPPLAAKVMAIKRWCMIPAALGWNGVYLYKHSNLRTLGDPARQPALAEAIGQMRDGLAGKRISAAAVLEDDSVWLAFTDGSSLRG
jgi:hypothetical protein